MLVGAYRNRHEQEVVVATLGIALARVKAELTHLVPEDLVRRLTAELPSESRERILTPVVTAYLALRKALHNTAITGLRHLAGVAFTPSAYCQARGRLPVGFFARLAAAVTGRLRRTDAECPGDRWCGRRTWLIDGSSFSRPDTPDLQAAFGQPGRSRDRRVTYAEPKQRPTWLEPAAYDALPATLAVREVRVRVRTPGRRVREVFQVTTLLNRRSFPAAALARRHESRWRAETNLGHLKTTLGLDVLRSQTETGILKEMLIFVAAYNLVRRVMRQAAAAQGVAADRISFVDALRWLRRAGPCEPVPRLVVNPERPGRFEPRVRKRRPKEFPMLKRPRAELKEELRQQHVAA